MDRNQPRGEPSNSTQHMANGESTLVQLGDDTTTAALYRESNLDKLYDLFADMTPFTTFVSITSEESKALIELSSDRLRQLRSPSKWYKENTAHVETLFGRYGLASRIDDILNEAPFHGECFVKTNTFSPKDYNYYHPNEVASLFHKPSDEEDNFATRLNALETAKKQLMHVNSGEKAIDLLIGSPRCIDSIRDEMEDTPNTDPKIAVRQWADIPNQYEFRVFMFNGQVTGITQLYYHIQYPEMIEKKNELADDITCFCRVIAQRLEEETGCKPTIVMDIGKDTKGKFFLIEFNPFKLHEGVQTTAGLFDWDKDSNILFNPGQFEMRIQTDPDNDALTGFLADAASWPPVYRELVIPTD